MSKYKVKEVKNKRVWENFVLSRESKSFLQSWNWGEVNKIMGHRVGRVGYYDGHKLAGVCLYIVQKAKRGPYIVVPGGPIIDWNNNKLVESVAKDIREKGVDYKVWFVRVRPELVDNEKNRKQFRKLGFVDSPMHLHAESTQIVDISKGDEDILYSMRKNTRYYIRKSLKCGLNVKISKNPDDYKTLEKLQEETAKRHKFVPFPPRLFRAQLETFADDDQAAIFIVRKKRKILAAAIIIFYGEIAYYHHSGSVGEYKNIPYSYFLQWKIIQEAKRRGMKYYNLWGVAPTSDTKHRFAGVTVFKKGFGGEQINWLHAKDLPLKKYYWFTHVFELFRKNIRGL
jgi:peptidoglycan pentaglycine glycine transferase (the first glycine)